MMFKSNRAGEASLVRRIVRLGCSSAASMVLGSVFVLSGCIQQETRLLTWMPRPPGLESKSYDLHDPFADEAAGPETFTRPRAFTEPRTETRKNAELRFLQASREITPQPAAFWDPLTPTGAAFVPVQPLWRTRTSNSPIAWGQGMWDGTGPRYEVVR
jgi:hypothetical protein